MNRCARCSGGLPAFAIFCPHCAQIHEPNFDELINLVIDGRYRIYRRLGQGGLSTIFAATDLENDNVVAIKISDPSQLARREMNYAIDANRARSYWDEMLERMRREAEALTHIDHPNIVRFHGTGLINDDLRYVAMEFLRGRTLRDKIDRGGSVEPSKAVGIALEITSALSEVHRRGIVHRDINPRNIMIADCGLRIADCGTGLSASNDSRDSRSANSDSTEPQSSIIHKQGPQSSIKLIDFGIAKLPQPPGAPPFTQHSTLAGTVAYASPEQCASHPVDHRSDIYSLGVVMYEMVTGQRPFNGRTPTEIALKQIQSEPKPPRSINPAISASLEKTILRSLAKDPGARQQSVEEMAGELQPSSNQIVIPLPATAPDADDQSDLTLIRNGIAPIDDPDEVAESELKFVRRRRRRFVVATAAILTAVIAAAILLGRPSTSSGFKAPGAAGGVDEAASASPTPIIGSDPDSLELAANMPNNVAAAGSNTTAQAALGSIQQIQPVNSTVANTTVKNKAVARTAIPPTPSPVPAPIAPKTHPQMPPAPTPSIAIARAPLPASDPDLSQAPRKDPDGGIWRREDDTANDRRSNGDTANNRRSNGDMDRDSDRADEYDSNRRRNDDVGNRRRLPDPPNRNEVDRGNRNGDYRNDDEEDHSARNWPKLIQWSGRVNEEREITIEMPGVPGTIEIPRAYRHRVGIVEPPSANNRWRCAVLRVFGRGGVSIIVRWWPAARNSMRFTARR